jgi:hypothetical protein
MTQVGALFAFSIGMLFAPQKAFNKTKAVKASALTTFFLNVCREANTSCAVRRASRAERASLRQSRNFT